jgi:hypothetical protein
MGRSIYCYDCNALKENPAKGYCRTCNRKRDNEWRLKTGRTKKHQTGLCPCGSERSAYNPAYCVNCASKKRQDWLNRNLEIKKKMQDRGVSLRRENYISTSQGRIRRSGSLINGEPVLCSECDKLTEGWCENCDLIYWWRKEQYHADPLYASKIRTRALTRSYIKSRKLIRKPCEVRKEIKVQAHHDDYTKPLDVRWLCNKHHAEHHKNEKK